jgi:hypothetical protein
MIQPRPIIVGVRFGLLILKQCSHLKCLWLTLKHEKVETITPVVDCADALILFSEQSV